MTPRDRRGESRGVNAEAERTGKGVAMALAAVELAALVLIWLSWVSSYWSWDPQSYGDPPGPYLQKAAFVPAAALVAAVVAGIRRVRVVAVGQVIMAVVICGILIVAKDAGEHAYETSYRDACHAGVVCDAPPSAR
ncbi:DUF6234 family protein [Streptomyces sp. NPDC101151]|uniref:DUF6234 family protein n=1 Tax=Streptomyces sp. NPDC101151 TaxID=3366115 RepID=UPI0037FC55B9